VPPAVLYHVTAGRHDDGEQRFGREPVAAHLGVRAVVADVVDAEEAAVGQGDPAGVTSVGVGASVMAQGADAAGLREEVAGTGAGDALAGGAEETPAPDSVDSHASARVRPPHDDNQQSHYE